MTKGKSLSIGAAMKNRMQNQDESAAKPTPTNVVVQVEQDDPLESFNTRLPRSLQRRLKVYTAQEGSKIQDVVQAALEAYFGKKES
jgi:D-hexose-6-phosphate mutarotase